ncbi:MAG: methylmalonyl-CoA mutase family protein, partial [Candidatus Bathyarchaeota archaeon]
AFTLANGVTYVEAAVERGLLVDEFAPRLSFFFAAHNNLIEEVAKFRAARRIWAELMKKRFGAENKRSMWMRMHVQTSGCALTAQQPINNITRVTIQTLAAVLGGAQSIHTNSFDEALALPSERAVRTALRTQQIVAHESGATDTIDPLGGSYYLETLTDEMEEGFWDYLETIEGKGGVVKCIESGFFQREIADSSYEFQKEVEAGERIVVGVNKFKTGDDWIPTRLLRVHHEDMEEQIERVKKMKAGRDKAKVEGALDRLRKDIERDENLMPAIVGAVKEYVTVGEICDLLRGMYGDYQELIVI